MKYSIKQAKANFPNLGFFLVKNGVKIKHFYDKKEALEVKKSLIAGTELKEALKIGFQKTNLY